MGGDVMSARSTIQAAALAAVALLFASADTTHAQNMVIGGTFTMDAVIGSVGDDLLGTLGHENSWTAVLRGVTWEHLVTLVPGGDSPTTMLLASSFELTFYGPDADVLNTEVASRIEAGALPDGGLFWVQAGYYSGGMVPLFFVRSGEDEVLFDVRCVVDTGTFAVDDEGYPVIGAFSATGCEVAIADAREGHNGDVWTQDGGTMWLEIETPAHATTWGSIKALRR
jgi:hypothetical protein